MMNPDIFLSQEDVHLLTQAFDALALEMATADDRRNLLINAGVHSGFSSKLNLNSSPYLFANQLVAQYREYRVSELRPIYHPMICLLEYLLQIHDLDDQTRTLFQKLVKQGQENFQGLAARKTVGRIKAPLDVALGTGVLIDQQLILTCKHVVEHVFTRKQEHAWVRFVYKTGRYGIEMGKVFELDIKDIVCQGISADAGQDYALIRIKREDKTAGRTSVHWISAPYAENSSHSSSARRTCANIRPRRGCRGRERIYPAQHSNRFWLIGQPDL